jgi:hypothetical protein
MRFTCFLVARFIKEVFHPVRLANPILIRKKGGVGHCSQMLYIKNKATQLLMIKNLRSSKHYILSGIMILK